MPAPPNPFPPDVLEAIAQGNPVEAIKRLRRSGFGLAEAKALVDAFKRGDTGALRSLPHVGHIFDEAGRVLPAEVVALAQRGDVPGAIRLLRERTGIGLKEARARVEAALETSGPVHTGHELPPAPPPVPLGPDRGGLGQGEVPRSNAAAWTVLALIAVLIGYLVLWP